jgi:hypothetical protein
MNTVFFSTETAVFEFDRADLKEQQFKEDNRVHIVLELIAAGRGSVTCKTCNKLYKPNQLHPIIIGAGKSPFDINTWKKRGIKSLFRKKKQPALFGGRGYKCPEGHVLISVITWRT